MGFCNRCHRFDQTAREKTTFLFTLYQLPTSHSFLFTHFNFSLGFSFFHDLVSLIMAVELMMAFSNDGFVTKLEDNAVQEAASGLESVNKLIRLLSQQNQETIQSSSSPSATLRSSMDIDMDCKAVADVAVSKFKKVISLLGRTRTGHARFRKAPVAVAMAAALSHTQISQENQLLESKVYYATPIQQIPPTPPVPNHYHDYSSMGMMPNNNGVIGERKESSTTINFSYSSAGNSFVSSLTGDTTDGKQPSSSSAFQITNPSQVSSAGKPPLSSSSLKRKCSSENLGSANCSGPSGRCHCSKKRKLRLKRVVRVPAISLKMSDIPPDDYSWRKYGQKPIKGSPHPRGYYKCSSVRGCPARKHVERALDDPSMLVVTYEGEHNHNLPIAEPTNLILESS
ncbi:probable WRKY transcription factor 15 isoform X2 [Manihot esculenta]|uniref:WRKY domain-containing protein n=1 Tax=Manihot esculenta TaxID=3983 RepID=A0A2C9UXE7_MANES|nr:probable WRKY transcription factor 15 isoform X2 [Manihot esculenta]